MWVWGERRETPVSGCCRRRPWHPRVSRLPDSVHPTAARRALVSQPGLNPQASPLPIRKPDVTVSPADRFATVLEHGKCKRMRAATFTLSLPSIPAEPCRAPKTLSGRGPVI